MHALRREMPRDVMRTIHPDLRSRPRSDDRDRRSLAQRTANM
jgi:hypothetical protein